DPLGFGGGQLNLYQFVASSPLNGTDPTGLIDWPSFLPNPFADWDAFRDEYADNAGKVGAAYGTLKYADPLPHYQMQKSVIQADLNATPDNDPNVSVDRFRKGAYHDPGDTLGAAGTVLEGGGAAVKLSLDTAAVIDGGAGGLRAVRPGGPRTPIRPARPAAAA